jgi:hypothetical protein
LTATLFHEWHIGETVQLSEPADDIHRHGFQQDAALHAAHTGSVAGQAKRQRQTHGLAAAVLEDFGNAGVRRFSRAFKSLSP